MAAEKTLKSQFIKGKFMPTMRLAILGINSLLKGFLNGVLTNFLQRVAADALSRVAQVLGTGCIK